MERKLDGDRDREGWRPRGPHRQQLGEGKQLGPSLGPPRGPQIPAVCDLPDAMSPYPPEWGHLSEKRLSVQGSWFQGTSSKGRSSGPRPGPPACWHLAELGAGSGHRTPQTSSRPSSPWGSPTHAGACSPTAARPPGSLLSSGKFLKTAAVWLLSPALSLMAWLLTGPGTVDCNTCQPPSLPCPVAAAQAAPSSQEGAWEGSW